MALIFSIILRPTDPLLQCPCVCAQSFCPFGPFFEKQPQKRLECQFPLLYVIPLCLRPPRPATGVSRALRARSVLKVSRECPRSVLGHLFDTLGTLSGHFLDTPEPGAPETLRGTLPETPRFLGTLSGTLPGTLRARRARETHVAGRWGRNPLSVF